MKIWLMFALPSLVALGGYTVGGLIAMVSGRWLCHHLHRLTILCGGLLIGLLMFEFFPHTFYYADPMGGALGLTVGILILLLLDQLVHQPSDLPSVVNTPLFRVVFFLCIGISLHNFMSGMAIGSGFTAQSDLIPYMQLALFLHHIPEGLAISLPLLGKSSMIYRYLSLAFILSVIVGFGTLAGLYFGQKNMATHTWLIGMATGTIGYVTFHEILWKTKPFVSRFDFVFYLTIGILLIKFFL